MNVVGEFSESNISVACTERRDLPGGGPSRVLILDQHAIVRAGLRVLLRSMPEIDVVADSDGESAILALVEHCAADVVIMDLADSAISAVKTIQSIAAWSSAIRIVILTSARSEAAAAAAFDAGAHAYVLKQSSVSNLLEAARMLRAGRSGYIDSSLNADQVDQLRKQNAMAAEGKTCSGGRASRASSALTPREREVLIAIANGARNQDIADQLSISRKTIETHRLNLINKLDAHNTAHLVRWAVRLGLFDPSLQMDGSGDGEEFGFRERTVAPSRTRESGLSHAFVAPDDPIFTEAMENEYDSCQ